MPARRHACCRFIVRRRARGGACYDTAMMRLRHAALRRYKSARRDIEVRRAKIGARGARVRAQRSSARFARAEACACRRQWQCA